MSDMNDGYALKNTVLLGPRECEKSGLVEPRLRERDDAGGSDQCPWVLRPDARCGWTFSAKDMAPWLTRMVGAEYNDVRNDERNLKGAR